MSNIQPAHISCISSSIKFHNKRVNERPNIYRHKQIFHLSGLKLFILCLVLQYYYYKPIVTYIKNKCLKETCDMVVFQGLCVGNSCDNSRDLRLLPTIKRSFVSVSTQFSFYASVMQYVFIMSETYYESQDSLLEY